MSLNFDVVPPLSDDVQLTVDQYRSKLYEVSCIRLILVLSGSGYTSCY